MANLPSSTGCLLRSVALRYRPWGRGSWPAYRQMGYKRSTLRSVITAEDSPAGGGSNSRDERLVELEAILFLASQPMSSRKLAQLAGLADGTKARTLVRTLNRMYDACGCAFRIEEVAGGFQLMSRAKLPPGCGACKRLGLKFAYRARPWKHWPWWPIANRSCEPK